MDLQTTDIVKKWDTKLSTIDAQLYNMWNFILYNQFVDKEVESLNKTIKDLSEENSILKLKRKLDSCCDDDDQPLSKKNKTSTSAPTSVPKQDNILKNEYKKKYTSKSQLKYNFMTMEKKDEMAKLIYKKLDSIQDIIELKNHPAKYDFINDVKFTKLYNIIPALEELNLIIGMKNVKEKLFNSICYFLHLMNCKEEMNHVMLM